MGIILPGEHVQLNRIEQACRAVTPAVNDRCPAGASFVLIMTDGKYYTCAANIDRTVVKRLLLGMLAKLQSEGA